MPNSIKSQYRIEGASTKEIHSMLMFYSMLVEVKGYHTIHRPIDVNGGDRRHELKTRNLQPELFAILLVAQWFLSKFRNVSIPHLTYGSPPR
jgi:hypothetical protein